MMDTGPTPPVVVGIDGSKQALRAASWAVDEAVGREAPLHLVYVVDSRTDDSAVDRTGARLALDQAERSVEAAGQHVELESEILCGDPAAMLIEASRNAQLVCVGAKGKHDSEPARRGITSSVVAESAFCPVAIIRRRHTHRQFPNDRWVVAVLDESPISHGVLQAALDEAEWRGAPLLALTSLPSRSGGLRTTDDDLRAKLDRYLQDTDGDGADVRVYALPTPANMADLLAETAGIDQLVVVGMNNPSLVAELVGPQGRSLLRKTNCSVLVFRERQVP